MPWYDYAAPTATQRSILAYLRDTAACCAVPMSPWEELPQHIWLQQAQERVQATFVQRYVRDHRDHVSKSIQLVLHRWDYAALRELKTRFEATGSLLVGDYQDLQAILGDLPDLPEPTLVPLPAVLFDLLRQYLPYPLNKEAFLADVAQWEIVSCHQLTVEHITTVRALLDVQIWTTDALPEQLFRALNNYQQQHPLPAGLTSLRIYNHLTGNFPPHPWREEWCHAQWWWCEVIGPAVQSCLNPQALLDRPDAFKLHGSDIARKFPEAFVVYEARVLAHYFMKQHGCSLDQARANVIKCIATGTALPHHVANLAQSPLVDGRPPLRVRQLGDHAYQYRCMLQRSLDHGFNAAQAEANAATCLPPEPAATIPLFHDTRLQTPL
jgi:hypothetical protein